MSVKNRDILEKFELLNRVGRIYFSDQCSRGKCLVRFLQKILGDRTVGALPRLGWMKKSPSLIVNTHDDQLCFKISGSLIIESEIQPCVHENVSGKINWDSRGASL